jgi:inner membrane protein
MPDLMWIFLIGGCVLLICEMFLPGYFLLWVGVASLMNGVIYSFVPAPWQVQMLSFAALAIMCVFLVKRFWGYGMVISEQPMLNQTQARLIGQKFVLSSAINGGQGTLKIGDTLWQVAGQDMAAGQLVEITSFGEHALQVKAL